MAAALADASGDDDESEDPVGTDNVNEDLAAALAGGGEEEEEEGPEDVKPEKEGENKEKGDKGNQNCNQYQSG